MIFSAAMVSFWNISERRQSYASDTSDGSVCSLPSSAPKLLSSPQNAAITAGGTPYSFSARLNAAACIRIRACAFFAAPSDALFRENSVNTWPNTRWPRSRLTMLWS